MSQNRISPAENFPGLIPGFFGFNEMPKEREGATERKREALEHHRLVKGSKSPTSQESAFMTGFYRAGCSGRTDIDVFQPKAEPVYLDHLPLHNVSKNVTGSGRFAVVGYRQWSNEYRIRTQVDRENKDAPPEQSGERVSEILSANGARKIAESCEFMAAEKGGYSTFLTLTCDAKTRKELDTLKAEPYELIDSQKPPAFTLPTKQDQEFKPVPPAMRNTAKKEKNNLSDLAGPFTRLHYETGRPYTPIRWVRKTTIQKQTSRFFDAMQKMYMRGWSYKQYQAIRPAVVKTTSDGFLFTPLNNGFKPVRKKATKKTREGLLYTPVQQVEIKVKGSPMVAKVNYGKDGAWCDLQKKKEKLDYCWVCEVPDTIDESTGEITGKNPHIHVLMRWRVPYRHFRAWARRVESLWGQGMAHLEKIKKGESAGAYMAKAAKYLTKAQGKDEKKDQGTVYGNRYNISRDARAPDWVCVGRYELGRMGWLLSEASEEFESRFGYVNKKRDQLVKKLEKTENKIDRQKIGKLLEKTRETLKRMPRLHKYQAILKGEKQYSEFMQWAKSDKPGRTCEWLPEKGAGESFEIKPGQGVWYAEFFKRRCHRQENLKWSSYFRESETNHYWIDLISHYNQFSPPDYEEGESIYFYQEAIKEGLLQ